jgi:hypothetical protein
MVSAFMRRHKWKAETLLPLPAAWGPGCLSLTNGAYIEQTLHTAPGKLYDLSFWIAENNGPFSEMTVEWNGEQIADATNPASNTCLDRWSICHFVEYSYPDLLATSNATVLEINGRQDPGYMIFDDFSVTPVAQAAEPEAFGFSLSACQAWASRLEVTT